MILTSCWEICPAIVAILVSFVECLGVWAVGDGATIRPSCHCPGCICPEAPQMSSVVVDNNLYCNHQLKYKFDNCIKYIL